MRKQTKLVAVLSAASLLAIGASMTAFAETPHWDQENGEWVYLDRNGDKVAGEWKKSNGQWYYLDDDGYMAKDALIDYNDDRYYVDANGVKVTNAWVAMDNDDYLDDDDVSTVWFYFDGNGKAVGCGEESETTIKKLSYGDGASAYFIFDNNGVMLSGWQTHKDKYYYLGEENEGWARTGWQLLDPSDAEWMEEDEDGNPYEDEEWFYFDSKGKATTGTSKNIGGKWYAFDNNGVMLDLWVYGSKSTTTASNGSSSTITKASDSDGASRYHTEDVGARETNWVLAYASNGDNDYDDTLYWFYLDSKGRPTLAYDGDGTGYDISDNFQNPTERTVVAKSIKNKTYLFDDAGRMRTGLFELDGVLKGGSELNGYFYFTEEEGSTEGQMVTNKKITIEVDGEDETYYFKSNGEAYTKTIISGSLYGEEGALVNDWGDGSTYEIKEFDYDIKTDKSSSTYIAAGTPVLVNGNGKIKKSGTVTDINGVKVTVKQYVVVEEKDADDAVTKYEVGEMTALDENGKNATYLYQK